MNKKTQPTETVIDVRPIRHEHLKVNIVGTSPLIMNRMSEKVRQGLLFPPGKKTAADKAANLKHDPLREYQDSVYRQPSGDTLLTLPAVALKSAMMTAALDLPGATKTQIGRLVYVRGDLIPVYGIPKMLMSVVRMADIKRTPDVRTRAIVPAWAATVEVSYAAPLLTETVVATLLAAAGIITGVGDFRVEKGKGTYGQFEIVEEADEGFAALRAESGRKAQEAAMEEPEFYDYETGDLFAYYASEVERTGRKLAVA